VAWRTDAPGGTDLSHRFAADGAPERLPSLAAELVHLKIDVIVNGGNINTVAAKQVTTTIPIVMAAGGLMSYGASRTDQFRHAVRYVARLLKGRIRAIYRSSSRPNSCSR